MLPAVEINQSNHGRRLRKPPKFAACPNKAKLSSPIAKMINADRVPAGIPVNPIQAVADQRCPQVPDVKWFGNVGARVLDDYGFWHLRQRAFPKQRRQRIPSKEIAIKAKIQKRACGVYFTYSLWKNNFIPQCGGACGRRQLPVFSGDKAGECQIPKRRISRFFKKRLYFFDS